MRIIVENNMTSEDFSTMDRLQNWLDDRLDSMDPDTILLLGHYNESIRDLSCNRHVYRKGYNGNITRRRMGCESCRFRCGYGDEARCMKGYLIRTGYVCGKFDPEYRKTRFKTHPHIEEEDEPIDF